MEINTESLDLIKLINSRLHRLAKRVENGKSCVQFMYVP